MRILFNYFIDLEDKRCQLIKEYLLKKGERVFNYNKGEQTTIKSAVFIFSPAKKFLEEEIINLPNNSIIFTGNIDDNIKKMLKNKNITYFNFLEEDFNYQNAILTAEGTLSIIFTKSNLSIFDKQILVFGFGRIGKALSMFFNKLSVNFSVATFNKNEFEQSIIYTKNRFFNKTYVDSLKNCDVIINTIPKEFLTLDDVKQIKETALFIELASISSINENIKKPFIYEHARALPQKTTLISATNLMIEQMEKQLWKKI